MACNWLPHNLKEVAQAINDYLDGKEPMLSGPDFPTGGIIINKKDIPNIMKTGHGSVKIRGQYKIEKENIVFYEIPYGTTTENIMNEIGTLCEEKELEGIIDIRDESTLKGMRIVIQCDKKISPASLINKIFAKTNLQHSISYNQVALVNKTPTELNLKDCIKIYLEHNENCLIKETDFDKTKAEARKEIVEGLLRALEDIDNIIALIKKSASSAKAKDRLIEVYKFTENQAKAIVNMKLGSLAGLEKIELQKENAELEKALNYFDLILSDKEKRLSIIRERLNTFTSKYGDERKTELTHLEIKKEDKEIAEVIPEDVVITMTKKGEIKKIPSKNFKIQKRNGKGIKNEGEALLDTISTNTIDTLMLFSDKGKMYRILVDNIPTGTNASRGCHINSLIKIGENETIIAITSLLRENHSKYVVFFTQKGLIKKTCLEEYSKTKKATGIQAIKINEGDSISNVSFINEEDVILITKKGMAIHFETKNINPIGRVAAGVKAIKLEDDDIVLKGLIIEKEKTLSLFTSKGYGKKVNITEFPLQGRGGKGVICYKNNDIIGHLVDGILIKDTDTLLLTGPTNNICISASEVPLLQRTGVGNIMIKGEICSTIKL